MPASETGIKLRFAEFDRQTSLRGWIVASGQIDLVDRKATGNRPRIGITDAAYTKFLAKREIHRSAA
jgi:hypothetical protein